MIEESTIEPALQIKSGLLEPKSIFVITQLENSEHTQVKYSLLNRPFNKLQFIHFSFGIYQRVVISYSCFHLKSPLAFSLTVKDYVGTKSYFYARLWRSCARTCGPSAGSRTRTTRWTRRTGCSPRAAAPATRGSGLRYYRFHSLDKVYFGFKCSWMNASSNNEKNKIFDDNLQFLCHFVEELWEGEREWDGGVHCGSQQVSRPGICPLARNPGTYSSSRGSIKPKPTARWLGFS